MRPAGSQLYRKLTSSLADLFSCPIPRLVCLSIFIYQTLTAESCLLLTYIIRSTFQPNISQQALRATLHMVQFGVAYFIMLLAMYYNGYFMICIIIGAWLGPFIFNWESVTVG